MKRRSLRATKLCCLGLLKLALPACDSLLLDNPANCVRNVDSCSADEFCNAETRRCETLDCTVNAALCTAAEECVASTKRCATRTFVLGQPDAVTNRNAAYGLYFPWSATLFPDPGKPGSSRLAIADAANHRVLLWNDVPAQNRPADAVLGMPDVNTLSGRGAYDGTNEGSMQTPWSVSSDGTNLVVGDFGLSRLLIFNPVPTQPGNSAPTPAISLWGQTSFLHSQANAGLSMVHALGVDSPRGFFAAPPSREFYVVDWANSRVLTFDELPRSPTQTPSALLGQATYGTNTAASGASGLSAPRFALRDGNTLYVVDGTNHRVLTYDLSPFNPTALTVLGQVDMNGSFPNRGGGVSASGFNVPTGACLVNDGMRRLFIADQQNHRVLRFTDGAGTADLVLGQANFTDDQPNRGGAPSPSTLHYPTDVISDGTRLIVSDYFNHRLLIWNTLPQVSGAPADRIIGQSDGVSVQPNAPPQRSGLQFDGPVHVAVDGARLVVVDGNNHRVLLYNALPQAGATLPDVVLGQRDFSGHAAAAGLTSPTASTLWNPTGASVENGKLAIADQSHHRVLLYNVLPTQSFAPADFVIGQPDFAGYLPQPPQSGLNGPAAVLLHQGALYVADSAYNRVLIYNNPFREGATADLVLGQPDLNEVDANNGGEKASTLAAPQALHISDGKLFVADSGNHRVLVFSLPVNRNFQAADVVIGQLSADSSYTRADRLRLDTPQGIVVHNGRLYVSSTVQNRILYWNQVPTVNGQRADGVLGQTDFLATLPNNPDVPAIERLSSPSGLAVAGAHLLIADLLNHRVVFRGLPK
jgi:hypothetical protein